MTPQIKKIGVITGTGCDKLELTKGATEKRILTKYGIVKVLQKEVHGKTVLILRRHGHNHYSSPGNINYRANIAALKQERVTQIIATSAAGSLLKKLKPGNFTIITDFMDFTQKRIQTFEPRRKPRFIDLSNPYDDGLRKNVEKAAKKLKIKLANNTIYLCTEGPRFETKAEIRAFQKLGAHLVGMTNVPEVVLANEAGIPYASIGIVTNYACGISPRPINTAEVIGALKKKSKSLSALIAETIKLARFI